jgi:hypothetical protein
MSDNSPETITMTERTSPGRIRIGGGLGPSAADCNECPRGVLPDFGNVTEWRSCN